jgi:hypothetical protein
MWSITIGGSSSGVIVGWCRRFVIVAVGVGIGVPLKVKSIKVTEDPMCITNTTNTAKQLMLLYHYHRDKMQRTITRHCEGGTYKEEVVQGLLQPLINHYITADELDQK